MTTTKELADHLLATAPAHADWSLVESPNSQGCYDALIEWARTMPLMRFWKEQQSIRPQLGLVLLWLCNEAVRRKGGYGTVWPAFIVESVVPWNQDTRGELFDGWAVKPVVRELMKEAAKLYSLRNTFEDEGQKWYRLVYLQFGFTHEDAVQRLASWLSGQVLPVSVQLLLAAKDSGAIAFQELWSSLRMFRLGNLSKNVVEARLKSNPWVLPEWCSDLMAAAKSSQARGISSTERKAGEISFFTTPKLHVSVDGEPVFTTSLCNLESQGLQQADYQFRAADKVLARLLRQPDGSYYSDANETIALPTCAVVPLTLVASNGDIAAHGEAMLWNEAAEVTLYSVKTGLALLPEERVRSGTAVHAITSEDVTLRPAPESNLVFSSGYRIQTIPAGWTGQIEGLVDGEVVWSGETKIANAHSDTENVFARFSETLDISSKKSQDEPPPWNLPIQFYLPEGWSFAGLRWRKQDGTVLVFEEQPQHLPLSEIDAVRPILLRLKMQKDGKRRTELIRASVPLVAVIKWTTTGQPRRHGTGHNLLLGEARKHSWSFCVLPDGADAADAQPGFIEGNRWLGEVKSRPSRLPDLAGYGASLCIARDPYQSDKVLMKVAEAVIDGGALGAVKKSEEDGLFHIRSAFSDLSEEHRLQAWHSTTDDGGLIEDIPHDQLEKTEFGWKWAMPEGRRLHGLCLSFRGTRIGTWFDHYTWSQAVINFPAERIEAAAALLRAWKAPILKQDGEHFQKISKWLAEHYARIIPVWLAKSAQPSPNGDTMEMPRLSEAWCSAVNELLTESLPVPDGEAASALVSRIAIGRSGIDGVGNAMMGLLEVCPILAANVVKVFLKEKVSPLERANFLKGIQQYPFFIVSEQRAEEIGFKFGNRDGAWLSTTVPRLASIHEKHDKVLKQAYRLLVKNSEYRNYAFGRWIPELH